MSIGASILLIAIGAILRYALDVNVSGVDIDVVGLILMIAGVLGLVLSLFMFARSNQQAPPPPPPPPGPPQR